MSFIDNPVIKNDGVCNVLGLKLGQCAGSRIGEYDLQILQDCKQAKRKSQNSYKIMEENKLWLKMRKEKC